MAVHKLDTLLGSISNQGTMKTSLVLQEMSKTKQLYKRLAARLVCAVIAKDSSCVI